MYSLFKQIAFKLSAETSHELTLDALTLLSNLKLTRVLPAPKYQRSVNIMGLEFPNSVGLAAGLDKNGEAIAALGALGFGFVEVGTVTPKPQAGNAIPRVFRIPEKQAIINRMGFNNKGIDYLVERVKSSQYSGIIGINIGKNKDTPPEKAVDDYLFCLDRAYQVADYIAVNLSSPNTKGLRDLQFGDALHVLLESLKKRQSELSVEKGYTPIAIKIAPDLSEDELKEIASTFNQWKVDGVIVSNTTLSREAVEGQPYSQESGGLSGAPVRDLANHAIKCMREQLHEDIPIIGVGGIMSEWDAMEKIKLGADLVQIYSGLIYEGPGLIKRTVEELATH